ncbi:MAG: KguA [Parcubacteria group bacterium GW2011_GWA2_56_7]|nr:MAG: KguA [Parcubacteria group bacterium GW2011_GWA2_56_7]
MNQGRLFLLTGTSGAGKTTVATELLRRNKNLRRVITYTTRAPREGEREGVSYHFVDAQTFHHMIDAGEFFEWAEVYGNRYGETRKDVETLLGQGFDVLLVLDPQGAKTIKTSGFPATALFLDADDETIIRRLRARGKDDEASIQKRVADMAFDRSHQDACDYVIQNKEGHLDTTIKNIEGILAHA